MPSWPEGLRHCSSLEHSKPGAGPHPVVIESSPTAAAPTQKRIRSQSVPDTRGQYANAPVETEALVLGENAET